jgi:hypothetical protein
MESASFPVVTQLFVHPYIGGGSGNRENRCIAVFDLVLTYVNANIGSELILA